MTLNSEVFCMVVRTDVLVFGVVVFISTFLTVYGSDVYHEYFIHIALNCKIAQ